MYDMTNSALMQLQGCLSCSANKITIIKLLQMKELIALNQIQVKSRWDLLGAPKILEVKGQIFPICSNFAPPPRKSLRHRLKMILMTTGCTCTDCFSLITNEESSLGPLKLVI